MEDSSVLRLRFSTGAVIVACPNHPFVFLDEIVASAKTLRPGDLVLDASFQPVGVLRVEDIDDFTGGASQPHRQLRFDLRPGPSSSRTASSPATGSFRPTMTESSAASPSAPAPSTVFDGGEEP